MKITTILAIIAIVVIIAIAGWCFLVPQKLMKISNSTPITSPTLAVLGEPVGTLYFEGEIVETTSGVETITFYWKADVTAVEGMIHGIGMVWFDILKPEYDVDTFVAWRGMLDIGVRHTYEATFTWTSHDVHILSKEDGIVTFDESMLDYSGLDMGWDGGAWRDSFNSDIFSRFMYADYPASGTDPSQWDTNIETPHFTFVRQGDNFWFE